MKKYIAEFIGTFFLVLTIGCTVLPGAAGVIPPLAIGAILMTMIFAGGHISGAHFNPAVTLAVFVRGRCAAKDVLPYWIAQVLAALAAASAAVFIAGKGGEPMVLKNVPAAFLAEFLFTFALAYVVVNVATAKANAGNSFYGLAIGMTVMAGAFSVGGVSAGVQSGGGGGDRDDEAGEFLGHLASRVADLAGGCRGAGVQVFESRGPVGRAGG